jgi:hypothetical protein
MRMSERCGDDLRDDLTYARKKAQAVARTQGTDFIVFQGIAQGI